MARYGGSSNMVRRIKPGIEVPEIIDLSSLMRIDESWRRKLSSLTLRLMDLEKSLEAGKAALIGEKNGNLYIRVRDAIRNHGLNLRIKTVEIDGVKYVYVYKPEAETR
ncbi:MAG: hypothetical protein ACXQTR_05585 [Candidatus Methanospirareceae archaeon]